MALDASVICLYGVEASRIHYVRSRWMRDVFASGAVAFFAAHIPLRHPFSSYVVVDRVTAIAKRSGGPFHVVGRVQRRPPIGAIFHEIWPPDLMCDVPLFRQNKVIIADFLEIALFPSAPVNEGDVVFREMNLCRRLREIGKYGVRVFLWVAYDIRHSGLFPAFVDLWMACLARSGAYVMSVERNLRYLAVRGIAGQNCEKDGKAKSHPAILLMHW